MKVKHSDIFAKFTSTFTPSTIQKWERMLRDWYVFKLNPDPKVAAVSNPFEEPISGEFSTWYLPSCSLPHSLATTLQDVRLKLTKEDAAAAAKGAQSPHKTSVTSFLVMGMDLEDQQWVIYLSCVLYHLIILLDEIFLLRLPKSRSPQCPNNLLTW